MELKPDENTCLSKYFAVALPIGVSRQETDAPLVFTELSAAKDCANKYAGARIKIFSEEDDAIDFASHSVEERCPSFPEIRSPGERPSPYKSATSQQIVKLRKAIEIGDVNYFLATVWSNPSYLVNSGDAPTIMHEGYHYNALHIAARHKQTVICKLLLETIQNPKFLKLLYEDDTEASCAERIHHLLDFYLNNPDKGLCETPLHFASKFGCLSIVSLLLSHSLCDKNKTNKYGQTAKQIVGQRCSSLSKELKNKLLEEFEDKLYVPLLRDEYNAVQPIIGDPCTFECIKHSLSNNLTRPTEHDAALRIKAYAGPMSPDVARKFQRLWKKPVQSLTKNMAFSEKELKQLWELRLSDITKGQERIGRRLAQELKTGWSEYWSVLSAWVDLSSAEGLDLFENFLKKFHAKIIIEDYLPVMFQTTKLGDAEYHCNKQDLTIYDSKEPKASSKFQKQSLVSMDVTDSSDDEFYTPLSSTPTSSQIKYLNDDLSFQGKNTNSGQTAYVTEEEFFTPPTSFPVTPYGNYNFYIELFVQGLELSNDDVDMYRAVEKVYVSKHSHPYVYRWKTLVQNKMK